MLTISLYFVTVRFNSPPLISLIETFSAKQNKEENKTSISAKKQGKMASFFDINALAPLIVNSENAGL